MARVGNKKSRAGAAALAPLALAAPLLGAVVAAAPASAQAAGGFVATGSLVTPVSHATATLLSNGEVLVAGGQDSAGGALGSAELYNPSSGAWTPTASMPVPVTDATATLLANGEVLVAGGLTESASALVPTTASQLYDPVTGQWSLTPGQLQQATFDASAALLGSGDVLYVGGLPSTSPAANAVTTAESYDPSTGLWSLASSLPTGVAGAEAASLSNGEVLLAGGETGASGTVTNAAEVYSATSNAWSPVAAMPVGVAYAATTKLSSGEVLVAGGETTPEGALTAATQVFNPSSGSWQTASGLPASSFGATATLLGSGEVLYAGGLTSTTGSGGPIAAAEVYNPSNGTWTMTGSLLVAEGFGTATLLGNGDVLIAGGQAAAGPTAEAELYVPTLAPGAPAITSPSIFDVVAGSFNTFTVTTTGTPAPTITESGALPPGMNFTYNGNGTATIAGTPPAGTTGVYTVTVTASNGVGTPAAQQLSLVVASSFPGAPAITSASSFSVTAGMYGSFTVTTTGTPAPTITESGALPPGMHFTYNGNGTATISGTPPASAVGSYVVTLSASNGVGAPAVQQFDVTVESAPVVVSAPRFTSSASVLVLPGANAVVTITASGTPRPVITESGTLPPGMSFAYEGNGRATISGVTPGGLSGTFAVRLTASNGTGSSASQILRMTVGRPAVPEASFGAGYWYTTAGGEVIGQGSALPVAPVTEQHPSRIVSMAPTADHLGYYLASSAGGVFPYGDARWYGSIAGRHLSSPTVAIAVTPSGGGYYLVTRAGNVFNFGDARWYGSTAGRHVPPIAAFALTPNGLGYWLVSVYGNIYAFGDARFYGSPANHLIPRVVAFAPTPDGSGYWLVTEKGNVFNYGNARWYGSLAQRSVPAVVAFGPAPGGQGYWLVTGKGNVFNFGNARWYGSSAGVALPTPVTSFAVEP
jgi:N-acetylneuraminic acid mutarotase